MVLSLGNITFLTSSLEAEIYHHFGESRSLYEQTWEFEISKFSGFQNLCSASNTDHSSQRPPSTHCRPRDQDTLPNSHRSDHNNHDDHSSNHPNHNEEVKSIHSSNHSPEPAPREHFRVKQPSFECPSLHLGSDGNHTDDEDHLSHHSDHNEDVKSIHSSNHSPEPAPREHFRIKQQSFECPSLHLGSDGNHTDDEDHLSHHSNHNEDVKSIHSSNHSPEPAPREHFRVKQPSFECPSLHLSSDGNHTDDEDHLSHHSDHNEDVKSIHSSNHSPEPAPREHFRVKQQSFECPSLHLSSDGNHTDDEDHLSHHSDHNEEVKSIP
ncbi:histidine-rich glycoprotein-like [Rhopilema esculentum]|uniref:histidine-rich glycoprotein-like n=1 Tax=Rhopilema esculentum TaxID=499914 RepID=UPI0031D7BE82